MYEGFSLMNDIVSYLLNFFFYMFFGCMIKVFLEIVMCLICCYEKLGFNIDEIIIDGKYYQVKEEVVYSKLFCDLIYFNCVGVRDDYKVLLVVFLLGYFVILLKGIVEVLLFDYEVYIIDWVDVWEVLLDEGLFSFDCYVGYFIEFLEFFGLGIYVIVICQLIVQVLIVIVVMVEKKNECVFCLLMLMVGLIDISKNLMWVNEFFIKYLMLWF